MIGAVAPETSTLDSGALQLGLGGFIEFATLFMPLLALASIALLAYWALGKYVLPRLLRGQPSPPSLVIFATPLVVAVVFTVASFQRSPIGYWGLFIYLVVLTGMIEGGVLVSRIAKLVSKIPDFDSEPDDTSTANDTGRERAKVVPPDKQGQTAESTTESVDQRLKNGAGVGLKKFLKWVVERILKWWYKRKATRAGMIAAVVATVVVYWFAEPRVASGFRLVEFVLSTFVAIATVNLLLWKLTKLTVADDPATRMDVLPVVGALVAISATTVARVPGTPLPGADRAQAFLATRVSYAERIVQALFTIPILDVVVILIHFVGVIIGALIGLYVWRSESEQPAV